MTSTTSPTREGDYTSDDCIEELREFIECRSGLEVVDPPPEKDVILLSDIG